MIVKLFLLGSGLPWTIFLVFQVRLTEPIRLGRARHVRITTRAPLPVQCDGEPWTQNASAIDVTFYNQVVMLKSPAMTVRKRRDTIESSSEDDDDDTSDSRMC